MVNKGPSSLCSRPQRSRPTRRRSDRAAIGGRGDADTTRLLFEQLLVAFNEDKRMTTAQSRNLDANDPMMTPWMDAALARFRRLLQQFIQQECQRTSTG